jgi:hypothetical protein
MLPVNEQQPARTKLWICESHNTSMARLFEDPVSKILPAMIRGEVHAVSSKDCALVLAWWVKTASLFEIVANERAQQSGPVAGRSLVSRDVSRARVLELIETGGAVQPGWILRLGLTDFNQEPATATAFVDRVLVDPLDFTSHITHFGFLIGELTIVKEEELDALLAGLSHSPLLTPRIVADAALAWPPATMSQPDLDRLRSDWWHGGQPLLGWEERPARRHSTRDEKKVLWLTDLDAQSLVGQMDAMASLGFPAAPIKIFESPTPEL